MKKFVVGVFAITTLTGPAWAEPNPSRLPLGGAARFPCETPGYASDSGERDLEKIIASEQKRRNKRPMDQIEIRCPHVRGMSISADVMTSGDALCRSLGYRTASGVETHDFDPVEQSKLGERPTRIWSLSLLWGLATPTPEKPLFALSRVPSTPKKIPILQRLSCTRGEPAIEPLRTEQLFAPDAAAKTGSGEKPGSVNKTSISDDAAKDNIPRQAHPMPDPYGTENSGQKLDR